jgi:hypothetical protein
MKPTEDALFNDYLKAVPSLTINRDESALLQKQVEELTAKSEQQKDVIKARLAETENELRRLIETRQDQFEKYMKDMLETRSKLNSPMAALLSLYDPNSPALEAVQGIVQEEEEKIKSKLRNDYTIPNE